MSFDKPATDDLLQIKSKDGIVLYRHAEIYQWVRKLSYVPDTYELNNSSDEEAEDLIEFRYEKIWS